MKLKRHPPDEIISLLGEGVEVVGEIAFTHGFRVDGSVKGKIRSESTLVVGPKGKVEGEASIRRISITGEFRGSIKASERVEIHRGGKACSAKQPTSADGPP